MHPHTEKMPRRFKSDAQRGNDQKRSAAAKRLTLDRRAIRRAKREGVR